MITQLLTAPMFATALVFLALRRRPRFALSPAEGFAVLAFALIGTLQGTLDGQIHVDDVLFTACYLALPAAVGAIRGGFHGFVATTLGTIALMLVAGSHPLDGEAGAGGMVFGQWLTLWIVLVGVAGAAGALASIRPALAMLAPLLFVLFAATHGEGLLHGTSVWAAVALASGIVGALVALRPVATGPIVDPEPT